MKGDPILYIKPGCPWCEEALAFFSSHGVSLEVRNVTDDYQHLKRMIAVSGQTKTPTFEWGEFVVADFGVDELLDELQERPDVKMRLGIADDSHIG